MKKERPWWRRKRWPLYCATSAAVIAAFIALSFVLPFSIRYGRRCYLSAWRGGVTLLAFDNDYVGYGLRANRAPLGEAVPRWHIQDAIAAGRDRHALSAPSLGWKEPITAQVAAFGTTVPTTTTTTIGHMWSGFIPLGYPALALGAVSTIGFVRLWRHRHPPGHCQRCGYNRAGIEAAAACPECGCVPAV